MSETLKEIGEWEFIRRLVRNFHVGPEVLGTRDDSAAIPFGDEYLLFCVDSVDERVDFLPNSIPQYKGGYAVASTLSDIAAMGGTAIAVVVNWGIDGEFDVGEAERIAQGMQDMARRFDCDIVGGDIQDSPFFSLSVSAIGLVPKPEIMMRSGAQPGDAICVWGTMAEFNSINTWYANRERWNVDKQEERRIETALLALVPMIREGRILAKSQLVNSCIDMSDGLYRSLKELCLEGNLGSIVWEEKFPLGDLGERLCKEIGDIDPEVLVSSKNAFQLLFTTKQGSVPSLRRLVEAEGGELAVIGMIEATDTFKIRKRNGELRELADYSYEHWKTGKIWEDNKSV